MDFSSVHNYYEQLVYKYLQQRALASNFEANEEFLMDTSCLALNKLPARYIRHEVDMAFFVDAEERELMEKQAKQAVDEAFAYMESNFNKDDRYTEVLHISDGDADAERH